MKLKRKTMSKVLVTFILGKCY